MYWGWMRNSFMSCFILQRKGHKRCMEGRHSILRWAVSDLLNKAWRLNCILFCQMKRSSLPKYQSLLPFAVRCEEVNYHRLPYIVPWVIPAHQWWYVIAYYLKSTLLILFTVLISIFNFQVMCCNLSDVQCLYCTMCEQNLLNGWIMNW